MLKATYYFIGLVLMAYKLVAYKKCKVLIILITPPLALYNINLLTNLNWERRQIRHGTVKKHCVMIYGMRIFPPWINASWTIAPHEIPPGQLTPGLFPLENYPWIFPPGQLPPGQLPPIKFPSRKLPFGILPSG